MATRRRSVAAPEVDPESGSELARVPGASAKRSRAVKREHRPITDDQLCVIIENHEVQSATSSLDVADRRESIQYYMGEPFGDEVEGRSQVVSREVADTIEWIKPSLMRIFASGDEVVKFDPHGPEDLDAAEQESDVLNWYVLQRNNAFTSLYTWFTDALLSRNGYLVVQWDESVSVAEEDYEHVSAAEMQMLRTAVASGDVEIVEEESYFEPLVTEVPDPMTGTLVPRETTAEFFDVSVRVTNRRGTLKYRCIPPERMIVDGRLQDVSLLDSDFAGYWEAMPLSDLRRLFPDEDIPDDIEDEGGMGFETENISARDRLINWRWANRGDSVDPSMRIVRVVTCWVRADRDGDGIAERRHVIKVGRRILYDEPTDIVCIASLSPMLMPHRHLGISVHDIMKDLQEVKSMLLRGIIDNAFLANAGRLAVNFERVDMNDVLVSRPGGVIRTQGDPSGAIMPISHPSLGNEIVNTMEYLDAVGEKRTGVTKYSQGLDANTLNKTATGISLITQAASQRVELIARLFAESGVRDLMLIAHSLLRKHGDQDTVVKLRGKWVPINPREWVQRYDMTVSVGLGTGDRAAQAQSLGAIREAQAQLIPLGLVSRKNAYDTAAKLVKAGGWKDVGAFFTDPTQQPEGAQQPNDPHAPFQPPDPKAQADQQKSQIEMLREQNAPQIRQMELDNEFRIAQYKINAEMQAKVEIERVKVAADAERRQMEAHARMLSDQMTQHAQAAGGEAARLAGEQATVPVLDTAHAALGPIVQQVGALAQAVQHRNRPRAFHVVRNPDGSKIISEVQ